MPFIARRPFLCFTYIDKGRRQTRCFGKKPLSFIKQGACVYPLSFTQPLTISGVSCSCTPLYKQCQQATAFPVAKLAAKYFSGIAFRHSPYSAESIFYLYTPGYFVIRRIFVCPKALKRQNSKKRLVRCDKNKKII